MKADQVSLMRTNNSSAFFMMSRPLNIGGFLNDNISPHAIWIGGLLIGLASVSGIFIFNYISSAQTAPQVSA